MDHNEEIRSWVESVDRSLTASLLLGRNSARAIAKAHLSELFRLVEGERSLALAEIKKVNSFGSRRLFSDIPWSHPRPAALVFKFPKQCCCG